MSNPIPFSDSSTQTTWGNMPDFFVTHNKGSCDQCSCFASKNVLSEIFCQSFEN